MIYHYEVIIGVFMQAIHVVCEQYSQDLMRISHFATNRAEEKLEAKMNIDKAKIKSLEVKLA